MLEPPAAGKVNPALTSGAEGGHPWALSQSDGVQTGTAASGRVQLLSEQSTRPKSSPRSQTPDVQLVQKQQSEVV